MIYLTEKGGGISKTIFISGIILAIVASSIISYVLVTQLTSVEGLKGEQGDTGPMGPQGPQGEQGPAGVAEIPFAHFLEGYPLSFTTSSEEWTDIKILADTVSAQITVDAESTLLITFNAYLRGEWLDTTAGWARLEIRALIDDAPAMPETVYALEVPSGQSGSEATSHNSHSSFFLGDVAAGTHTIKIQCKLLVLTEAVILYPSLVVQAFPN